MLNVSSFSSGNKSIFAISKSSILKISLWVNILENISILIFSLKASSNKISFLLPSWTYISLIFVILLPLNE